MGFRTHAIQKQSSEVWRVLGAVKTEFGRFGDTLDKVKKKLDETRNTIDEAVHRSRQMEKKLRKVEALPVDEASTTVRELGSEPRHSRFSDALWVARVSPVFFYASAPSSI